jgi:hypothetical protein
MIILEGPDGTGKTTLAKKIANALNLNYVKIPRHKNDTEVDGFKFYMKQATSIPDNCVVDRFHIGECVYPQLYTDDFRTPLKMWEQHAIERVLQARGCVLIHTIANYDFIEHAYRDRDEHFCLDDVIKENELFAVSIFDSLLFKKTYITTCTNDSLFITFVEKYHQIQQTNAALTSAFKSSGSNIYPIMFVGDALNEKDGAQYCFSSTKGSSPYLQQAIDIAGCKNNYYLTNAFKVGNNYEQNLGAILHENYIINPLIRIALGKNASNLLNAVGLPHKLIEHPAHHKRFHHDVYAYAHLFNEVIL